MLSIEMEGIIDQLTNRLGS